jgi:site-specific recombinase XerD
VNYPASETFAPAEAVCPGQPRCLDLAEMADYDALCLRSAGRKPATIAGTRLAISKLDSFLRSNQLPLRLDLISADTIRRFIIHLGTSKKFAGHPFTHAQQTPLSAAAINGYLRALRAAFARWADDGMIATSPFTHVRIPAPHYKPRLSLTKDEIIEYLGAFDTAAPEGFRDYVMVLTYFDTGARLSGLRTLQMDRLDLERGSLTVTEKGDKERLIFIGKTMHKLLWRYVKSYRPEPAFPDADNLFLTRDGRPLTKGRIEARFRKYALKAGLDPHRFIPHVMRHSFCTHYMDNHGEISDLQALTGHSNLKTLSIYLHPSQDHLKAAHRRSSPVDNLHLNQTGKAPGPARLS